MTKKKSTYVPEPLWIVVDGPDGAGKTTLIAAIKELLAKNNHNILETKALGQGPIGKAIRKRLLDNKTRPSDEMQSMMLPMGMIETYNEHILPALEKRKSVITDRWLGSFFAYQVYAERCDAALPVFNLLNSSIKGFMTRGMPGRFMKQQPDIYFICDVDPEEAERRLAVRAGQEKPNRLDKESLQFKRDVRDAFVSAVPSYFDNAIILDCNKPIEEVVKEVKLQITFHVTKEMFKKSGIYKES